MKKTVFFLFFFILPSTLFAYDYDSTSLNSQTITDTLKLVNTKIYVVKGYNLVKNGGKLIIEKGTLIYGKNRYYSIIVIERGAKIIAEGTPSQPIVFTSSEAPNERSYGDGVALIILGRSGTIDKSSFNSPFIDSTSVPGMEGPNFYVPWFGGQPRNDSDSSGVLRYVRFEYCGTYLVGPYHRNSESLILGGVGSKTVIENIQISHSGYSGLTLYGGNVNIQNIVLYRNAENDIKFFYGYRGKLQFGIISRDSNETYQGDRLNFMRSMNTADTIANSYNYLITNPVISNFTIIGPKMYNVVSNKYTNSFGFGLSTKTKFNIYNSIFTGLNSAVRFDRGAVYQNALNDSIQFRNNIFSGFSEGLGNTSTPTSFSPSIWLQSPSFQNRVYPNPMDVNLLNPYAFYNLGGSNPLGGVNWYNPLPGSPALTGASFSNPNLNGFTQTSYVGAIGSNNDWIKNWTCFNPHSYLPRPLAITNISSSIPEKFYLSQNYPNPFNPATTINFSVPVKGFVSLKIYDITGKEIAGLVNQEMNAGEYKYDFNASHLNSGVYFYTLKGENFSETKKMMLIK